MFLILAVFVLILWGLLRNIGIISSWLLSTVLRCPLEVGSVGWCRLSDVRLRLPSGLLVHVDVCQIQLFSTLVSKPLLLSLGDVRVEGDTHSLAQASSTAGRKPSNVSIAKRSIVSRVVQMVQYCGLYINRGHLVLLDALPGCMIHVTVDELLVEAFRSRESWQLEVSCRLARGKAMLRRATTGHSLLDVALQFRLSLDVAGGRLINVRFRIEDPTVDLSSGVFAALEKQTSSSESSSPSEEVIPPANGQQTSSFIADLSDLSIETNNCLIKYNGAIAQESRTMILSVRGLSVLKDGGKVQARIAGLTIEDQGQRFSIRTSLLVLSHEIRTAGVNVQISSDSVQTKLSVQDLVWWKIHADECIMSVVGKAMVPSKSVPQRGLPTLFAVELASISCDLVDLDSFQSTLSVQFFSITKTMEVLEIGVDCLCISAPYVNTADATFERHQWGQSVFIGAALVQCRLNEATRGFIIGIDDCKLEWSDKLAEQIKQLSSVMSTNASNNQNTPLVAKTVNIRLNMKRAAVISVVKESSYLALLCDEVEAECDGSRSFAISAQHARIVSAPVHETFVDLLVLRNTSKFVPPVDRGSDAPWRCWNQAKNDARKNMRAAAWDEQRVNRPQLCFETDVLCVTFEVVNPAISNVTCSSGSLVYLVWSPLLHRILYHMGQVIASTFLPSKAGKGSPRKSPRQLQYRLLTNHAIELVLELPRHHR
ncbi:hypothetical protein Y032_0305g1965 [Ancylostoma ceylanicum]|uniref:Uncharacterized protein n=1 Tax=Ancylostoma ceylanicum TaxID=53326 RepID=A0A016S449_9BILA|nr:hypothetical protein Y032_0305g1965 [Ancylostoma ceylanicum]